MWIELREVRVLPVTTQRIDTVQLVDFEAGGCGVLDCRNVARVVLMRWAGIKRIGYVRDVVVHAAPVREG